MTILNIIKETRKYYLEKIILGLYNGMCYSLFHVLMKYDYLQETDEYKVIPTIIPEFTPEFFDLDLSEEDKDWFWWDSKDTNSRIKAFDKLIEHYENRY